MFYKSFYLLLYFYLFNHPLLVQTASLFQNELTGCLPYGFQTTGQLCNGPSSGNCVMDNGNGTEAVSQPYIPNSYCDCHSGWTGRNEFIPVSHHDCGINIVITSIEWIILCLFSLFTIFLIIYKIFKSFRAVKLKIAEPLTLEMLALDYNIPEQRPSSNPQNSSPPTTSLPTSPSASPNRPSYHHLDVNTNTLHSPGSELLNRGMSSGSTNNSPPSDLRESHMVTMMKKRISNQRRTFVPKSNRFYGELWNVKIVQLSLLTLPVVISFFIISLLRLIPSTRHSSAIGESYFTTMLYIIAILFGGFCGGHITHSWMAVILRLSGVESRSAVTLFIRKLKRILIWTLLIGFIDIIFVFILPFTSSFYLKTIFTVIHLQLLPLTQLAFAYVAFRSSRLIKGLLSQGKENLPRGQLRDREEALWSMRLLIRSFIFVFVHNLILLTMHSWWPWFRTKLAYTCPLTWSALVYLVGLGIYVLKPPQNPNTKNETYTSNSMDTSDPHRSSSLGGGGGGGSGGGLGGGLGIIPRSTTPLISPSPDPDGRYSRHHSKSFNGGTVGGSTAINPLRIINEPINENDEFSTELRGGTTSQSSGGEDTDGGSSPRASKYQGGGGRLSQSPSPPRPTRGLSLSRPSAVSVGGSKRGGFSFMKGLTSNGGDSGGSNTTTKYDDDEIDSRSQRDMLNQPHLTESKKHGDPSIELSMSSREQNSDVKQVQPFTSNQDGTLLCLGELSSDDGASSHTPSPIPTPLNPHKQHMFVLTGSGGSSKETSVSSALRPSELGGASSGHSSTGTSKFSTPSVTPSTSMYFPISTNTSNNSGNRINDDGSRSRSVSASYGGPGVGGSSGAQSGGSGVILMEGINISPSVSLDNFHIVLSSSSNNNHSSSSSGSSTSNT